MASVNSADIDLNLLRVLDALLDTGSVVGAAARLHLSPPAVSRSLGRLRKLLGDPLFVRAGRELVPTELAKSLRTPTQAALGEALNVLRPDRFVAIVRKDHALAGRRLTHRRFAESHHVTVSPVGKRTGPIDAALAEVGLERKHITTVTSFVVAAHLVANTDLLGSVPRTIAKTMAGSLPIVSLEIPLALPTFDVFLTWHDRHGNDPSHQWLRGQIADAVRNLT